MPTIILILLVTLVGVLLIFVLRALVLIQILLVELPLVVVSCMCATTVQLVSKLGLGSGQEPWMTLFLKGFLQKVRSSAFQGLADLSLVWPLGLGILLIPKLKIGGSPRLLRPYV